MTRRRRRKIRYTEDQLREKATSHKLMFHRRSLQPGLTIVSIPPDLKLYAISEKELMEAPPEAVIIRRPPDG